MNLDWGQITPEGTNGNEFLYVYNHDISSLDKVDRTIRFVLGRLQYYEIHLPPNSKHIIKFDIRGQDLPDHFLDLISNGIKTKFKSDSGLNISFVK